MSSSCDVNILVTTGLAVVAAGVLAIITFALQPKNKVDKKKNDKPFFKKKNFTSRTSSQSNSSESSNIKSQDPHDSVMEVSPEIDSRKSHEIPNAYVRRRILLSSRNGDNDNEAKNQSIKTEINDSSLHHQQSKIKKAEEYFADDKLNNAATILQSIESEILEQKHEEMISKAKEAQVLVDNLRSIICYDKVLDDDSVNTKWVDQGISKGEIPTRILHKLDMEKLDKDGDPELTVVCESPIEKDLLAPLLFVLNESELYTTWLPKFATPHFEFRECKKLKQSGRVSQILHLVIDLPWPLSPREIVLNAFAFDSIEEDGYIGIKMKSIGPDEDKVVPDIDTSKSVEVLINGGFLFENCPEDHPCIDFSDDDVVEPMILVKFCVVLHPNLRVIPQSLLKFLLRVGVRKVWKILIQVAKDVKDGHRLAHAKAITEKEEFSNYLKDRVSTLLKGVT